VSPASKRPDQPAALPLALCITRGGIAKQAGLPQRHLIACAAALLVGAPSVMAQAAGQIVPTLTVGQSFTDNSELGSAGRSSEFVTTVSPGLSYSSRGGRIQGFASYALNGALYARDHERSNLRHSLNASLTSEWFDRRLSLAARASTTRASASALDRPGNDSFRDLPGSTTVQSYVLSPALRGRLLGEMRYEASLNWLSTRTGSATLSDSTALSGSFSLASALAGTPLSWSLATTRSTSDFSLGRSTTSARVVGQLDYRLSPDLTLGLRGGREQTELTELQGSRSTDNWGLSANWRPTERTRVSATWDQRFFGNGYSISAEHRLRRSAFRFTDSRDVSDNAGFGAAASARTLFDTLFAQFAATEPDPARREQLVDAFLRSSGLDGNRAAGGGFLSSAATVQRRQDLTWTMTGLRTSLLLSTNRSQGSRVDAGSNVNDDFAGGNVLDQRAYNLSITHRLTPTATAGLSLQDTRTRASTSGIRTEQRSVGLNWTTQLGRRTALTALVRHVEFDSPTAPYTENSVNAVVNMRF